MEKFLELEGGNLAISLAIVLITLFVTTRPFFSKRAIRIGMTSVLVFLSIAVGLHYKITTDRMSAVKNAFFNNQTVICESRAIRKVAQSVYITKQNEWTLEGDIFVSPNYSRPFHSARCIVK